MIAPEGDMVFVPFSRFVNLLRRGNGPINATGQLGILGLRIVTKIRHLQFHAVEGRVTIHGDSQSAAAVPGFAEFELEFEFKIAVFLFAEQPASARLAAVENSVLHTPHRITLRCVADVVPGAHRPTRWHAILGKKRNEPPVSREVPAPGNAVDGKLRLFDMRAEKNRSSRADNFQCSSSPAVARWFPQTGPVWCEEHWTPPDASFRSAVRIPVGFGVH